MNLVSPNEAQKSSAVFKCLSKAGKTTPVVFIKPSRKVKVSSSGPIERSKAEQVSPKPSPGEPLPSQGDPEPSRDDPKAY